MERMRGCYTYYEWQTVWEELDEKGCYADGDLDATGFTSLRQVKKWIVNNNGEFTDTDFKQGYKVMEREYPYITVYRLKVVKYWDQGLVADATIVDKKLEYFDDGSKIPKRFIDDFNRNFKWASIL